MPKTCPSGSGSVKTAIVCGLQNRNRPRRGVCYARGLQESTRKPEENIVGSWRRFGVAGPVYEILGQTKADARGERMMRIRVLETGEELDYKITDILDDPRER